MAVLLQTATAFRISRSLFRNDDGSPIVFYSEYNSDDLQTVIHNGGGHLIKDPAGASILLCEKRTDNKISNGYLPIDFIVDCVKKNAFLNVDTYRAEHLGLKASTSNCEASRANSSDEEAHMVKISTSSRLSIKASGLLGRKKYSDLEDLKIIKYLINHDKYSDTGGNLVWKQMELVKVTDHSFQSMKARFQKKILPDIDTYSIPAAWKKKLCGDDCSDTPEEVEGQNGHAKSFDDFDTWKSKEKRLKVGAASRVSVSDEKDSREPSNASSAKGSLTSSEIPATSSLHHQRSPAASRSSAAPVASSNDLTSEHLRKNSRDEIEAVVVHDVQTEYCEPATSNIGIENPSSPEVVAETQCLDYSYDELDCLILSEANRAKDLDSPEDSSKASNISNAAILTRKRTKNMINCDESSQTKKINRTTQSFATKENEMKSGNVVEHNSPQTKSSKHSSALNKKNMSENSGPDSTQQAVTDDQVDDDISRKYTDSLSKIVNIIRKGSFNSSTKEQSLLPEDSNVKLQNNEKDIHTHAQSTSTNRLMRSGKISSVDAGTPCLDADTLPVQIDSAVDKGSREKTSHNVPLVLNTESVENLKNVNRRPKSDRLRRQNSDQQTKIAVQSRPVIASFPKTTKKVVSSKCSSSNTSDEESDSSYRHKQRWTSKPVERPGVRKSGVTMDKNPATVEDLSPRSKESTARKVKYLSEEYGLDMDEAAYLLSMHDGCFLSVLQYFELV